MKFSYIGDGYWFMTSFRVGRVSGRLPDLEKRFTKFLNLIGATYFSNQGVNEVSFIASWQF